MMKIDECFGFGRRCKPNSTILWWALVINQLLILGSATVLLGLSAHIFEMSTAGEDIWVERPGQSPDTIIRYTFPNTLNPGPTWAITATGIGGFADAFLALLTLLVGHRRLTRKRIMGPLLVILFVSVVRSVTTVSYGLLRDRSEKLTLADLSRFNRTATFWRYFTPYGWSKQMQKYAMQDWAKLQLEQICREVRITWTLSLMIALLDFLALGTGIGLWITARREHRRW